MAQANTPENKSVKGANQARAQGAQSSQAQGRGEGGQDQELLVRRGGRGARGMRPFEDLDRLFEGFFPRSFMRPFAFDRPVWERMMPAARQPMAMPAVDVIDHENEIIVRAEVPGCTKNDLDLSMSDTTLTIRGHSGQEQKEEREDYYYQETSYGEFARSVNLPTEVDATNAQAKIKDGILEVTLPKAQGAKRRSIKVE